MPRLTNFKGIRPGRSQRLIGDTEAQIASNVDISSGEIVPLAQPEQTYVTTKPGPLLAIYKADSLWFTWAYDVDVCRSPLPATTASPQKWIYTGDGEPRITTADLADTGGGDDYPAAARSLGVPKPQTAPSVAPSGGVATDVTRYYCYTFYDDWNQESAISPLSSATTGKPDGTWAITGMDAAPVSSGNCAVIYSAPSSIVISLGATTGAVAGASNASPIVIDDVAHGLVTGDKVYMTGVGGNTAANNTYANPYWTVTRIGADQFSLDDSTGNAVWTAGGTWTKVEPHWMRVGEEIVLSSTTLDVATAPSSYTLTVSGDYSAATAWARKATWGTCTKRLYRTSGSTAQFQLVAENISATTYSDTLSDSAIPGDELISTTWELPPVDLAGVMTLPSGALCGFSGNEECFSEPFQPHAWPPEYRKRAKFPIVGHAQYSSGIVIGTTGEPGVILGHEPGQQNMEPVTGALPCLSKRSMVSMGDSVGYATEHGYVRIGDSGVSIITRDWYTRTEWVALGPSSMVADTTRGRLYIMTTGAGDQLLVFDYLDGTGLTTCDQPFTELFADPLSGKLYVSDSTNQDVREFDPADGVYMTADWMSKEVVLPEPINLGAAKVNFDSRWDQATYDAALAAYNAAVAANDLLLAGGDVGGEIGGDDIADTDINGIAGSMLDAIVSPALESPTVTFSLYTDGTKVFEKIVTDSSGFRLPSGYKKDTFAVRVQGQVQVKSVEIAQTMQGLKIG